MLSLQKHEGEYKTSVASTFENTHAFEMFFLIILRKYRYTQKSSLVPSNLRQNDFLHILTAIFILSREMAEKFTDLSGKYPTIEAKEELIKNRLRTCWWGPHATKAYLQHGWEGVEDSNGFREEVLECKNKEN